MRILVAEDDPALRSVLERGLRENGYVVDVVADGAEALTYLRTYEYELAVLDWRMPRTSGLEVLKELRTGGSHLPVLILTARDTVSDRVTGLDEGADDYLVKPFDFSELLARLRALQRREPATKRPVLTLRDLTLDPARHEVKVGGRLISTTAIEYSLLELLLRRSNAVVGRRAIAVHIWQHEADAVGSNTIDVHIARLRAKLVGSAARIDTVRGVGYRIVST